jgi:hypothetical protein
VLHFQIRGLQLFGGLQVGTSFAVSFCLSSHEPLANPLHVIMKSVSMLALAGTAAAASYPDFKIPHLSTHQPSGEKFGYYHIDFNVTSENAGSPVTSWCYA